jgi:hypothetical protein
MQQLEVDLVPSRPERSFEFDAEIALAVGDGLCFPRAQARAR